MKVIKFENYIGESNFDIRKYMKEMNPLPMKEMDPFDEEDWFELEKGDTLYKVENLELIFDEYDGESIPRGYKVLDRNNVIRDLILDRNRMINRLKVETEGVFRKINKIENIIPKVLIKNFNISGSDNDIKIEDIKEGRMEKFFFYYIDNYSISIDKYEANVVFNKDIKIDDTRAKELPDDDWWVEIEKNINEGRVMVKKLTNNILEKGSDFFFDLGNLYMKDFVSLVLKDDIVLENKNTIKKVEDRIEYLKSIKTKSKLKELEEIKTKRDKIDDKLQKKIDMVDDIFEKK